MRVRSTAVAITVALFIALAPTGLLAGNPLTSLSSGQPFVWPDGGRQIPYRTDLGLLGPMRNSAAVQQTAAAFQQWEDVATATPSYVHVGSLPVDVDVSNFAEYLFGPPDGVSDVIYDADGSIFELLFGTDLPVVYGFASDEGRVGNTQLSDVTIVLNGRAINYPLPGLGLTVDQFLAVQLHEIGHFNGLAHSVVNGEVLLTADETGPSPQDTFTRRETVDVETMYAFLIGGTGQETLARDDIAAFSTLYPEPGFTSGTGTITGRVLGLDGVTPFNGVNVIARSLDDPFGDAVSGISGALAAGFDVAADDEESGVYRLVGLTPGARYVVYTDALEVGAFPRQAGALPAPEEFWNSLESGDSDVDAPGDATPIVAVAGGTIGGIDLIMNRLRPGPIPISRFIESDIPHPWQEFPLPFAVTLCGTTYRSLYLNLTAGTLSFGAPEFRLPISGDWAFKFLTGPPQVAAITAEYMPERAGTVSFDETQDTFSVSYHQVPALDFVTFEPVGANSFDITIAPGPRGSTATVRYGDVDVRSGIAGASCGGNVTSRSERESDLTALTGRRIQMTGAAVFEEFAADDNDLQQVALRYDLPASFADQLEPNQSVRDAVSVALPFETASRWTTVSRGDVDFYRFKARRGDLIAAETVRGPDLDSLLGLFTSDGTLLAVNDDIGGASLFSRIMIEAPADGDYVLGVTTFGDADFAGTGLYAGRYVLTINTYGGFALPLDGDDVSIEVALPFPFPFQGERWNSFWASSNGSITFGQPEPVRQIPDLQLPGFLDGPPRIAPYFADLDPSGTFNGGISGQVRLDVGADGATVHWLSVTKLLDTDTTTFSVTIRRDGQVGMAWGPGNTQDVLRRNVVVGLSSGQPTAAPDALNLSEAARLDTAGTLYEVFGPFAESPGVGIPVPGAFDLSFQQLRFVPGRLTPRDPAP